MAAWESLCTSTRRDSVSLTGVCEKPNLLFSIPTIYLLPLQRLATKPGILNSPSSMLSSLLPSLYEVHNLHSLPKPTPATLSVTKKITFVLFSCFLSFLITSWQIDGQALETVSDFIFLGSKITADGDCSHEIKRHLLLGRKVMSNLDSILKSIDITLPTKVRLVKAMVFPRIMSGCESWTI